jgi:hypothetical protein
MSQRELMQRSLTRLRETVAEAQSFATGLRVPVNASSYTRSSLECAQPDMIAERIDTLDAWLATAGGGFEDLDDNWHVTIALGQLFDEYAIYIPNKITEPMKALQGRAASARMLDPIVGEILWTLDHMDKIIALVNFPAREPAEARKS